VTGVAGGLLDEAGESALLQFEAGDDALNLVMPAAELSALLSVCMGLAGQKLPDAGEADHPTIPVGDWRVGVTGSQGVVLALAARSGGALAFRLQRDQAREMVEALCRALAALSQDERAGAAARGRH
jgi:hypothetical protein